LHFHDFKPNFNILMNWTDTFANFEVNGRLIDTDGLCGDVLSYVYGSDSDPEIAARFASNVFGTEAQINEDRGTEPEMGTPFCVGKHSVQVLGYRTVVIDGKTVKLRHAGRLENGMKCFYLRDLVRALGGTFRYDSRLDRDVIWVK